MVYDHFGRYPWDLAPNVPPRIPGPFEVPYPNIKPTDPKEWQDLIEMFNEAKRAAEKVDTLTGQPDCEDPDKAKLLDRINALEKRLSDLEAKQNDKPRKRRASRR